MNLETLERWYLDQYSYAEKEFMIHHDTMRGSVMQYYNCFNHLNGEYPKNLIPIILSGAYLPSDDYTDVLDLIVLQFVFESRWDIPNILDYALLDLPPYTLSLNPPPNSRMRITLITLYMLMYAFYGPLHESFVKKFKALKFHPDAPNENGQSPLIWGMYHKLTSTIMYDYVIQFAPSLDLIDPISGLSTLQLCEQNYPGTVLLDYIRWVVMEGIVNDLNAYREWVDARLSR